MLTEPKKADLTKVTLKKVLTQEGCSIVETPDLRKVMLKDYIALAGRWDFCDISNFIEKKNYYYTPIMEKIVKISTDENLKKEYNENQEKIIENENRLANFMEKYLPVEMSTHLAQAACYKEIELLALAFCFKYREYLTEEAEAELRRVYPFTEEDEENLSRKPKTCRVMTFSKVREQVQLAELKYKMDCEAQSVNISAKC